MLDGNYLNAVNSSGVAESYPLWTTQDDSTGSHFLTYRKQPSAIKNIIIGIQHAVVTYLITNTSASGGYSVVVEKQQIITLSEKCPYTIIVGDYTIISGKTSFTSVVDSFDNSSYTVTVNHVKQSTSITPVVTNIVYKDGEVYNTSEPALSSYGTTYSYTDNGLRYARLFPDSDGSLKVYYDNQTLCADTTSNDPTVCSSSEYTTTTTCSSTNSFTGGCSVVTCTDSSNNGCSFSVCDSCGDASLNTSSTSDCTDSEKAEVVLCSSSYCAVSNYCTSNNSNICNCGKGCGDNSAAESNCYTCGCGGYGNNSGISGSTPGSGNIVCMNSGYNSTQFITLSDGIVKAYGSTAIGNTYKIVYNSSTGTYTTYVTTKTGETYIFNGICSDAGSNAYAAAKIAATASGCSGGGCSSDSCSSDSCSSDGCLSDGICPSDGCPSDSGCSGGGGCSSDGSGDGY